MTCTATSPSTVEANALCLTWLIVHRRQMHAEEWAWGTEEDSANGGGTR